MSEMAKEQLLELVYLKYGRLIQSIAFEILCNGNNLEDATQEVFLKCISLFDDYEEEKADELKGYICKAAKNTAIDMKRKIEAYESAVQAYGELHITEAHIEFKAFEDKYGFSLDVQEMLDGLNYEERNILCLKYAEGYSDEEIAVFVEKTVSAVQKQNYRARTKIRNSIHQEKDERNQP